MSPALKAPAAALTPKKETSLSSVLSFKGAVLDLTVEESDSELEPEIPDQQEVSVLQNLILDLPFYCQPEFQCPD
jgi:hypothetical protein